MISISYLGQVETNPLITRRFNNIMTDSKQKAKLIEFNQSKSVATNVWQFKGSTPLGNGQICWIKVFKLKPYPMVAVKVVVAAKEIKLW